MTAIRKTVFTLTVLHPAEDHAESLPVEDVMAEINNGMWIGQTAHVSTVDLADEKVVEELQAIGNDGTFFEDYLDAAEREAKLSTYEDGEVVGVDTDGCVMQWDARGDTTGKPGIYNCGIKAEDFEAQCWALSPKEQARIDAAMRVRNGEDCGNGECSIEVDTAGDRFCRVCGLAWGSAEASDEGEAMNLNEAQRVDAAMRKETI